MKDLIVTDESTGAGLLVYWRLFASVDIHKLRAAWNAAALEDKILPETCSPQVALARAVRECGERRRLVRKLEGATGHALVRERAKGDDLDYAVEVRVKLNAANQPVCEPADHAVAPTVRAAFWRHLDEVQPQDIGSWLCDLVRSEVQGVALRDTGGIYYVPPHNVSRWQRMMEVLQECSSHKTFGIPAMRTPDAVAAILDAIEQEAQREAQSLEDDLVSGKLRGVALRNRATRCEGVEGKVQRYEEMLGQKLDTLRARLEHLRADLTAAALTSDEEEAT
jgi:hypothetical protein